MDAFDRLADGIVRHAKAIVAVWVVIMICAVPLALKSGEVMNYDTDEMAGEDSESVQGLAVMEEYYSSSSGMSSSPVLILYYADSDAKQQVETYVGLLNAAVAEGKFVDEEGASRITGFLSAMSADGEDGSGIEMVIVYYSDDWTGSVTDDTPLLRTQISEVIAAAELQGNQFDLQAYVTGTPAISYDMETGATEDISSIDVFTILMILILVGLFFRSFITSTTPPITIGVAFVVVLAIVFGLGQIMNIFFITEILLIVSMMGAGCDYCIFILARYREELRDGKPHEKALHDSIKWAGESITVSAASVIIGFGAMSICSYSLVSTLGICLAIGIIVALLAALTLIPSIIALVGDRIFWPTTSRAYEEGGKATRGWFKACSNFGHRYFESSSRFSIKHAKAIVAVAIVVTIPASYVALTSETSYDMTTPLMSGDSATGMDLIGEYADEGVIMPDYAVLQLSESAATVGGLELVDLSSLTSSSSAVLATLLGSGDLYLLVWDDEWFYSYGEAEDDYYYELMRLADTIGSDDNIASVTVPFIWDYQVRTAKAYLGGDASAEDVLQYVIGSSSATVSLIVSQIYEMLAEEVGYEMAAEMMVDLELPVGFAIDYYVNTVDQLVGGSFATSDDGSGDVTYLTLSVATHETPMSARSMESIQYMKDVVGEFIEQQESEVVTASWITGTAAVMYDVEEAISDEFIYIEVLVIVLIIILLFFVMRSYTIPFRSVLTILMSIVWTLSLVFLFFDEVTWLVPLLLLVICLGLGMDYDILLTTRIKENVRSKGMSNDEAIHHAVVHSGSVITICGLIMGGAFGTLMISSLPMLQQFGFALCFAILVDALVVRTYIVPAVMHLLGDWNWKGPRFLQGRKEESSADESEEE